MSSLLSFTPFLLAQAKSGGAWQDVAYTKIGLAAAICIALTVVVGGVLQGVVFRKFRGLTPNTWRAEGPALKLRCLAARAIGGVVFPLMYVYTGMARGVTFSTDANMWLEAGVKFGVLVWAAVSLPQILAGASSVNMHRNVALGLLIDWFIVCVGSALVCTKFLVVPH